MELRAKREEEERKRREEKRRQQQQQEEQKRRQEEEELFRRKQVGAWLSARAARAVRGRPLALTACLCLRCGSRSSC